MTPETTPVPPRGWSYVREMEDERKALQSTPAAPVPDPPPPPAHPRFSGHEAAGDLTLAEQHDFCCAALELGAARYGADSSLSEECERPYLAAHHAVLAHIDELFERHVVGRCVPEGLLPGVPALLGEHGPPPELVRKARELDNEEWLNAQTAEDGMRRVVEGWRATGSVT